MRPRSSPSTVYRCTGITTCIKEFLLLGLFRRKHRSFWYADNLSSCLNRLEVRHLYVKDLTLNVLRLVARSRTVHDYGLSHSIVSIHLSVNIVDVDLFLTAPRSSLIVLLAVGIRPPRSLIRGISSAVACFPWIRKLVQYFVPFERHSTRLLVFLI